VNVLILPKIVGWDKRLRWKQALSRKEIAYRKEVKSGDNGIESGLTVAHRDIEV